MHRAAVPARARRGLLRPLPAMDLPFLILVLTLLPALLVLTDGLVIEKKWKGSRRRIRERYVTRRQQFHERAEQIRTKLEEMTRKLSKVRV